MQQQQKVEERKQRFTHGAWKTFDVPTSNDGGNKIIHELVERNTKELAKVLGVWNSFDFSQYNRRFWYNYIFFMKVLSMLRRIVSVRMLRVSYTVDGSHTRGYFSTTLLLHDCCTFTTPYSVCTTKTFFTFFNYCPYATPCSVCTPKTAFLLSLLLHNYKMHSQ